VNSSTGCGEAGAHIWIRELVSDVSKGGGRPSFFSTPSTKCSLTLRAQTLAESHEAFIPPRLPEGFGVGRIWRPVRAHREKPFLEPFLGKHTTPKYVHTTLKRTKYVFTEVFVILKF